MDMRPRLVGILTVGLGWAVAGVSPALAGNQSWGNLEQAKICNQEFEDSRGDSNAWGGNIYKDPSLIKKALDEGKVSAPCKQEIERRAVLCKTDPYEKQYKANELAKDGVNWCNREAFYGISDQILGDPARQKAAQAKKDAEEKAKLKEKQEKEMATVEMPTAVKKDAAIEKQIAAAYKKEYPDNTVLAVLLQSTGWSTERSNVGIITNRNIQAIVVNKQKDGSCQLHNEMWMQEYNGKSFAGPLSQRGAGSQRLTGILCEKVKAKK